jgi:hypothetical protein
MWSLEDFEPFVFVMSVLAQSRSRSVKTPISDERILC